MYVLPFSGPQELDISRFYSANIAGSLSEYLLLIFNIKIRLTDRVEGGIEDGRILF